MTAEAIFIDANIVMYAAGTEHPYRQPCQAALAEIVHGRLQAAVSAEIHQEILYRYLSLGLPEKAREMSERLEVLIPTVLPVTLATIRQARALLALYPDLPARDLLHVAVMLENGLAHILSTDRHFDQVREIQRIDPRQTQGRSA